jgi:hypothetical protein
MTHDDCDFFFDFVFLAAEVVGDGQVGPRTGDTLSLELVEVVRAGVVARDDFDGLGDKGCDVRTSVRDTGGCGVARKGGDGGKWEIEEKRRTTSTLF